jgi:hypothetical protein
VLENTKTPEDTDDRTRRAKAADWIKVNTRPAAIKETAISVANMYLYTRFGLNTTMISTIWSKAVGYCLKNAEFKKVSVEQNIVTNLPQEGNFAFNIEDSEARQYLVNEVPEFNDQVELGNRVLIEQVS